MRLGWALTLFVLVAGACGPTKTDPEPVISADTLAVKDAPSQPAVSPDYSEDPFYGFDLDDAVATTTNQQEVLLRLRNNGTDDALVFASAGAGEVKIDSVTAGNWTRVDLLTRAPVVTLHSTDLGGRVLRRVELVVGADTVREVLISAP